MSVNRIAVDFAVKLSKSFKPSAKNTTSYSEFLLRRLIFTACVCLSYWHD